MYSTITAHTRSFQAFFCTRATSFLPLTTGRNVGLTATMQQRPSALYHILSNPVNSTPTRRFSFLRAFSPVNPKTGTPHGVPVFRILLSIHPATRCLLPQNQQIGYCTCRNDGEPADKRCCPLEPPPEQRQEQPERKQMMPRFLIRGPLSSYRQHHPPVQARRRFPRPSRPAHGISR